MYASSVCLLNQGEDSWYNLSLWWRVF